MTLQELIKKTPESEPVIGFFPLHFFLLERDCRDISGEYGICSDPPESRECFRCTQTQAFAETGRFTAQIIVSKWTLEEALLTRQAVIKTMIENKILPLQRNLGGEFRKWVDLLQKRIAETMPRPVPPVVIYEMQKYFGEENLLEQPIPRCIEGEIQRKPEIRFNEVEEIGMPHEINRHED